MKLANVKANTTSRSLRYHRASAHNSPTLRNKLADFTPSMLHHPNVTAFPQIICSSLFPFPSPCISTTATASPMPLQQVRNFSWHSRASTEASTMSRNPLRPYKNLGEKVGEQLAFSSPPFPTTERAERRGDPNLTKNEAKLQNERMGMDVSWLGPHGAENMPVDYPEDTHIPLKEGGGGMGSRRVGNESQGNQNNSSASSSSSPSSPSSPSGFEKEEQKRKNAGLGTQQQKRSFSSQAKTSGTTSSGKLSEAAGSTSSGATSSGGGRGVAGNFGGSTSEVKPGEFSETTVRGGDKRVATGADVEGRVGTGVGLEGGYGTSGTTTGVGGGSGGIGMTAGGSTGSGTGGGTGTTGGATGRGAAEMGVAGLGGPAGVGGAGGVGAAGGPGGVGGHGGTGTIGTQQKKRPFSNQARSPGTPGSPGNTDMLSNNNETGSHGTDSMKSDNGPKWEKEMNRDNGRERLGRDESDPAQKSA